MGHQEGFGKALRRSSANDTGHCCSGMVEAHMNQDRLIKIARKHSASIGDAYDCWLWTESEVLAAMEEAVALAVEQCAQICDEFNKYDYDGWADECAAIIRAKMGKK